MSRVFFFWNASYAFNRWTAPMLPAGGGSLSANSEIAWHYAEALRAAFGPERVTSISMGDRIDRGNRSVNGHAIGPDDVCIGHIGAWAEDCHELGIKYIPMVSWPSQMRWPYDQFVYHKQHQKVLDRAASFIALCGEAVWEASRTVPMLNRWRDKAIQMRLGFDRTLFPQVKHSFNPPGERGFLFVGQVAEQKGTGPLVATFTKNGYRLSIGNGEWKLGPQSGAPNIEVLGWVDNSDQPFWQALAPKVDVFLSTSMWDCQPVAPLENLSRGFPVLGTPCSCIGPGPYEIFKNTTAFELAQSGRPSPRDRTGFDGLLPDSLSTLAERVAEIQAMPTDQLAAERDRQLEWLNALTWAQPLEQLVQIVRTKMEA